MARGTIKKLLTDRGFGFILPKDTSTTGKDIFFQQDDVNGTSYEALQVGQEVEYDLGTEERRGSTKATRVRPFPQI